MSSVFLPILQVAAAAVLWFLLYTAIRLGVRDGIRQSRQ
jgi:hypothetical protein